MTESSVDYIYLAIDVGYSSNLWHVMKIKVSTKSLEFYYESDINGYAYSMVL